MHRFLLVTSTVGVNFVLLALVAAAPASATVLCKNISAPCSSTYGAGTIIKAEVETGWLIAALPVCHESTMELEVTNPGSATENVSGTVKEFSIGSCNCSSSRRCSARGNSPSATPKKRTGPSA